MRTEKLIQIEIEESEFSRHDPELEKRMLHERGVRRNQAKARMLSVRLDPDEYDQIEEIAEMRGIPVSALVRGWIAAELAHIRGESVPAVVERLAGDVERLRNIVGRRTTSGR